MTWLFRLVLIISSFCTVVFILRKIHSSKIQIDDSLFWICTAFLIFIISLFPNLMSWASEILGIMSPVNFVFLFFIFLLLVKCFTNSVQISNLDRKVKELSQQIGIERLEAMQERNQAVKEKDTRPRN